MRVKKDKFYIFIVFFISAMLYIFNFPWKHEFLYGYNKIVFFVWLFLFFGVVKIVFKAQNFIVGIFLLLNGVAFSYFFYIFYDYKSILEKGPFDFSVFIYGNIQKVSNLTLLVILIMFLVLLLSPKRFYRISIDFEKIKKNISIYAYKIKKIPYINMTLAAGIILVLDLLIFNFTFNVFKGHYGTGDMKMYIEIPNFIRSLVSLLSLSLYILLKTKESFDNTLRVILFKLFLFLSIFFVDLSFGPRGSTVGMFVVLLVFDLLTDKHSISKYLNSFITLTILFLLIFIWPMMRFHIPDDGIIVTFLDSISNFIESLSLFSEVQFYAVPMIPQTLFHFLFVVDLIDKDISLNLSTFVNLISQQLPSFVENFGITRPLNDNYKLMKYFFHGGGFYIFANAYWNGGILVMSIFTFVVTYILIKIELFFKSHKKIYYIAYPLFIYLIPVNTFYGIQPFVRGIEYGLLGLLLVYFGQKIKFQKKGSEIVFNY